MKEMLDDRLVTVIAGILFLVAYVPLVVLSVHNHPSAADDYCFADTAVRYGFWQAQKYYYDGWTGRYFSNMLVHGNPLVWNWYNGFRVIPAVAATGLVAALYAFVGEILRDQAITRRLTATALLFFAIILALQSIAEAFFWTAAVASYTVPTILTIYFVAVLLRWYRLPAGWFKTLTSVWAGVLVFAIVGSGETNLLLLAMLLLGLAAYRLFFQRTVDFFLAYLLVVAVASAWLVFSAPGNSIRLNANEIQGNVLVSLVATLRWLAKYMFTWLWQTPIIPLSVFWLPVAVRLNSRSSSVRFLFQLPTLLLLVVLAGMLIVLTFPSTYGLGVPPSRVINLVYMVFIVGWFYTLTTLIGWVLRRGNSVGRFLTNPKPLPAFVFLLAGAWILASAWGSPTIRQLYGDLLSGNAATYDREMTERHQQLLQPSDTLRLSPISVYPRSLFIEDIHTNSDHWWNRCQAGYYGHKVVLLDAQSSTARR
ncbi:hypothetical protein GCM10027341_18410 [Spirosoma knui]